MQQSDLHVLVFEPDRERVEAFRRRMDAAGGVLTLPSWAGNCTCNYPLHTSLALVPMPPEFVQWSAWGEVAAEGWVRQVGINLGAPGNRVDEGRHVVARASPGRRSRVPVRFEPEGATSFYRRALWIAPAYGRRERAERLPCPFGQGTCLPLGPVLKMVISGWGRWSQAAARARAIPNLPQALRGRPANARRVSA